MKLRQLLGLNVNSATARFTTQLPAALLVLAAGCGVDGPSDESGDAPSALSTADVAKLREVVQRDPLTPEFETVCPVSRVDDLCATLRDVQASPTPRAMTSARAAAALRFAQLAPAEALHDAAIKFWLRERIHGLTILHRVAGMTAAAKEPEAFQAGVDALLRTHFPLYEPSSFRLAHGYLPPAAARKVCEGKREALVVFPGVIRLPSKMELEGHIKAVRTAIPCLEIVRVDTGTFIDIEHNAAKGREAIATLDAAFGPIPLHFLGYSQGVSNALQTIASDPAIASRTRSMVSLDSAAHGSEVADTLLRTLDLYTSRPTAGCDEVWPAARNLCKSVGNRKLAPVAGFLKTQLEALGGSFDDLSSSTVAEWLKNHVDGIRSLTTGSAAKFWVANGARLPTNCAYLTFRSVISDEKTSLPQSNWLPYQVLFRSSTASPWNDMQVRLVNQHLGNSVEASEVVSRVADGNHWLWALTPNDVSEGMMPSHMFENAPREELVVAHYEALAELGMVNAGR